MGKERICSVCKCTYKYCPSCKDDAKKPTWLFAFCSENCRNIYNITSDFENKQITGIEAKDKLEKLDLNRKEYFGESYKNSIASIMKAKTPIIKRQNLNLSKRILLQKSKMRLKVMLNSDFK
mgnify:CR=1 FL=1